MISNILKESKKYVAKLMPFINSRLYALNSFLQISATNLGEEIYKGAQWTHVVRALAPYFLFLSRTLFPSGCRAP